MIRRSLTSALARASQPGPVDVIDMLPWKIPDARGGERYRLAEVVGALSCALDITEGQPEGHAARSCIIGMRIAQVIGMNARESSDLYYALLLKDLGCSSNASMVCSMFGADDRRAKRELKLVDWSRVSRSVGYIARNVLPESSIVRRVGRFISVAIAGPSRAREMVQVRCERGAMIARQFQLSEATSAAIRSLDELWDGSGQPEGLAGDQIPLFSRIMNLAQTVEVHFAEHGIESAFDVVQERDGTWFDPALVCAFETLRGDEEFWAKLKSCDPKHAVLELEPRERVLPADDATLDRIAGGFGLVIDAKSPWTYSHSAGVAEVAEGIARTMQFSAVQARQIRLAALVHDVAKLGISNLILDKPGKLTPDEMAEMRKHPGITHRLLERVAGFRELAPLASAHHERLDGAGYHAGLKGDQLDCPARILAVADMYEALAAKRPYRHDLSAEEVLTILNKNVLSGGICPAVLEALKAWLAVSKFQPVQLAA